MDSKQQSWQKSANWKKKKLKNRNENKFKKYYPIQFLYVSHPAQFHLILLGYPTYKITLDDLRPHTCRGHMWGLYPNDP